MRVRTRMSRMCIVGWLMIEAPAIAGAGASRQLSSRAVGEGCVTITSTRLRPSPTCLVMLMTAGAFPSALYATFRPLIRTSYSPEACSRRKNTWRLIHAKGTVNAVEKMFPFCSQLFRRVRYRLSVPGWDVAADVAVGCTFTSPPGDSRPYEAL